MDGDAAVISQPGSLHHPLLQRLGHVLLGHVEDAQVGKATRDTRVSLTPGPLYRAALAVPNVRVLQT